MTGARPAIVLRRYRLSDTPVLHAAVRESLPELIPWMPWCTENYAMEESAQWIEAEPMRWDNAMEFGFAIVDAESGEYYGGCGLNLINRIHNYCNLGYWVRSSVAGKGIATAATRAIAKFGFDTLKMSRIEIIAAAGNVASQRVAEKAGAHREGVLRNRLMIKGYLRDAVLFSLIPGEV